MQGDVRSGFRTDCEILVYIDVPKLLSSESTLPMRCLGSAITPLPWLSLAQVD